MAYRSSINVKNINKSLSGLNKSLLRARDSARSVRTTITESTRDKRKSFSASISAFKKRREAARRREREDIVEASSVKGAISRSSSAVVNSTRGFLGRILDFLGTILVGWALTNLPSIIKAAQDLIERMKKYFELLNNFRMGLQNFLVSFGDMVGEVTAGLSRFDFLAIKRAADRGMKRMGDAFVQMNNSLDSVVRMLKQDINKLLGLDVFDIPAPDGGGGGGGNIPPDTGAPGGNDSGRARTGTKEQRALLDTLAMAEGTYNSGYSTWLGFRKHGPDDLTNLTIDEVHDLQGTFLSKFGAPSAAVGRYQFVPLREHARRFGANTSTQKFTPEFQDRLALFLAENRGVDTKKPIDSNDVLLLGKEWASVPGGGYGQDRYTVNQVLDMYKSLYGTVNMSTNVQAPPAAIQQKAAGAPPPAAKTPKVGQEIKYTPQEIEALKKANPDLDIESLLGSNVKNYSSQLAMALQNGRRKPKTNTLIFNNTVKQTEYIAEPSSGGSTIIVAGGLNSSDRRNKYLSTLA